MVSLWSPTVCKDATVLDYEVWMDEEESRHDEEGVKEKRVRTSQTTARIAGLRPSTRYVCQVRALSLCGWSRWSVRARSCTKASGSRAIGDQDQQDPTESTVEKSRDKGDVSNRLLPELVETAAVPSNRTWCLPSPLKESKESKGSKGSKESEASPRASCGWLRAHRAPTPLRVRQRLLHRLHAAAEVSSHR